jgi:hypothetical protein
MIPGGPLKLGNHSVFAHRICTHTQCFNLSIYIDCLTIVPMNHKQISDGLLTVMDLPALFLFLLCCFLLSLECLRLDGDLCLRVGGNDSLLEVEEASDSSP